MTHTLHIQDGEQFVKELTLKHPHYYFPPTKNFEGPEPPESDTCWDEWNEHLKTAPTYPLIGKTDKKHGDPMVDGVDFRFQHQEKRYPFDRPEYFENCSQERYGILLNCDRRIICLSTEVKEVLHDDMPAGHFPGYYPIPSEETQEELFTALMYEWNALQEPEYGTYTEQRAKLLSYFFITRK